MPIPAAAASRASTAASGGPDRDGPAGVATSATSSTDRGARSTNRSASRSTSSPVAVGCAVSRRTHQRHLARGSGSATGSARSPALKAMRTRSAGSASRAGTYSTAISARALASCQSEAENGCPSARRHWTSGMPSSPAASPPSQRSSASARCARRSATRPRVKRRRSASAPAQSNQVSGLSCAYALLLPRWLRPDSSPIASIGVPRASNSVASRLRTSRARRASTAASVVAPSTPWFHEWLASVPSRLPSPLASLCLRSCATRSASVKPSCAVTKLSERDGRFDVPAKRSADPETRVAKSATRPRSPRQKRRTVSRKRSFHSPQPAGNAPTR